jgi:GDPmannose 4,6-dehydratase
MQKALITGITGQDGSYLAEFLLDKGYEVHGIVRRSSLLNRERIDDLHFSNDERYKETLLLHYGDLSDTNSLNQIIRQVNPDEIYNLGGQSHVGISFEIPEYTAETTGIGVVRILEAIRQAGISARFYQASTSELFGKATFVPQNEETPFNPQTPYACAKAYGYYITKTYREAYHIFTSNGILYNHESPRRGENFVTRKISLGLSRIKSGIDRKLILGNLDARRDWGYAGDYIVAMWQMLQCDEPDDYVIATHETHSVREFIECGCEVLGINLAWEGEGIDEKGFDQESGEKIIEISPQYFRPNEVSNLVGDYSKAKLKLGWEPKIKFPELVKMMVESDLARIES